MRAGDLDRYVSQFRSLANKAGYDLDAPSTIQTFLKGLPSLLGQRILRQHPNTDNFNQYLGATQSESKGMERENLIFEEGKWLRPNWIKLSPPQNPRLNRPTPTSNAPTVPLDVHLPMAPPWMWTPSKKQKIQRIRRNIEMKDSALNAVNKGTWPETVQPRNLIQGHPRNHLI